jgi:WD40 repeat protein
MIRLWHIDDDSAPPATLTGHGDWISRIAFAPDGQVLASSSNDGTVRLWSVADGTLLQTIDGQAGPILDLAFTPDGATLAAASFELGIRLWHLPDGASGGHFVHPDPIWSLAMSPDGALLAAGSEGEIAIWRWATGERLQSLVTGRAAILSLAFSVDGTRLAAGTRTGATQLWDTAGWQAVREFR